MGWFPYTESLLLVTFLFGSFRAAPSKHLASVYKPPYISACFCDVVPAFSCRPHTMIKQGTYFPLSPFGNHLWLLLLQIKDEIVTGKYFVAESVAVRLASYQIQEVGDTIWISSLRDIVTSFLLSFSTPLVIYWLETFVTCHVTDLCSRSETISPSDTSPDSLSETPVLFLIAFE